MKIKRKDKKSKNAEEEGIDAQKVDKELNYRAPPKPPYILYANGKVIGIIENVVSKTRPPPNLLEYTVVLLEKEYVKERNVC